MQVDSLQEAEEQALGPARAVRDYLEDLREGLDRTPWPDRAGELIRVTRIAVPVRVLKKVLRPHRRSEPQGEDRVRERPRRYVDPEVARYYEEPDWVEDQEEVDWGDEMARVRRAVILGAPGGGKTFLTQWTVLS